ncbi:hypothetical protein [Symmachiella dynata]|uniref:hypothetical protein n=1 Tax=Symmachiella dynata TaxID=2527995 RepID=UPI0030ECB857|tara:strand:- start:2530 stop:3537 length:1008 start_codon:yes stop_codon:yes gene_type:complete
MTNHEYPTVVDDNVVYNLPKQSRDPSGVLEGLRYFQTVQKLPDCTSEQLIEEWTQFHEAISGLLPPRYLAGERYPDLTPLGHWETVFKVDYYSNFDLPRGRTVWLILFHELIREEFITLLQNDILAKYPLWRVYVKTTDIDLDLLTGAAKACDILVYPNAVRYGNLAPGEDKASDFSNWKTEASRVYWEIAGSEIRQFEWVKSRVPKLLPMMQENEIEVVGAVDCGSEWSLWYLEEESQDYHYFVMDHGSLARGEVSKVMPGDNFSINRHGEVGGRDVYGSNNTKTILKNCSFPKSILDDLEVHRKSRQGESGDSYKKWRLIVDSDLIAKESDFA